MRAAGDRPRVVLDLARWADSPAYDPEAEVSTVAALVRAVPSVDLVLVGPAATAAAVAASVAASVAPLGATVAHLPAGGPVDPSDADRGVRAHLDAPTRVGVARVAAGSADVLVTTAPTPVALAAARVALPALTGAARPVLAAVLDVGPDGRTTGARSAHPVVLADVGGAPGADGEVVTALVTAAAGSLTGGPPRVRPLLTDDPASVGPADLLAGAAEGVVADGRSGRVLLEALQAAEAVRVLGHVVLGRAGPVVVAQGGSAGLVDAVRLAVALIRGDLVGGCVRELAVVVAARRAAAGFPDAVTATVTGGGA